MEESNAKDAKERQERKVTSLFAAGHRHASLASFALLCGLCVAVPLFAAEAERLPDPLTLEHALSLADGGQPDLERARAAQERAEGERLAAEAIGGLTANVTARLRTIEPDHRAPNQENDDSSVELKLRKRLFDFGRGDAALAAAESERSGRDWEYLEARQRMRLEIMARFFDVLLADLAFVRDNEALAVAYIGYDKDKVRSEQGRRSEVELLRSESEYQQVRHQRALSEAKQRAARSRLAIALNHTGRLPAQLDDPKLPILDRKLPEVEELTAEVLQSNPKLLSLRAKGEAAGQRLEEAKRLDLPVIYGDLDFGYWERPTNSTNPMGAALVLEMPISDGGRARAERAKRNAEWRDQQALAAQGELELRQEVLDLWLELSSLKVRREQIKVASASREMNLDRSRALYEMEVNADLGDSMVQVSEQNLRRREAEFQTALAWARLDALRGRLIENSDAGDAAKPQEKTK